MCVVGLSIYTSVCLLCAWKGEGLTAIHFSVVVVVLYDILG